MLHSAFVKAKLVLTHQPDAIVAACLLCLALAVRLPYLTLVPPFWNSELGEALAAAQIATGSSLPLMIPGQPHIGPVALYPLALILPLGGLNPFTPRVFAAVAGALTVIATFLLGRSVGSRGAATCAGLLAATNAFHILINSHIFWTNSLTPLFTTTALTVLIVSLRDAPLPRPVSRRGWLIVAFFMWGLALQSHPSVWTLLPGLGLAIALVPHLRLCLRAAWSWRAPLAFLFAYGNVIAFNLATGFASLAALTAKSYALPESNEVWQNLPGRLSDLAVELIRVLSSNLPVVLVPGAVAFTAVLWFTFALALCVKKRQTLLLYPTLSAILLLALANKAYNSGYAERYIMFLLPVACVMMGLAVEYVWQEFQKTAAPRVLKRTFALLAVVALAWWFTQPLAALADYYDLEIRSGRSNQTYLAWNDLASQYANSGYQVLLDPGLNQFQVVLNASDIGTTLAWFFEMHGIVTAELAEQTPSGEPVAQFALPLARSGTEEQQRELVVCVIQNSTARRFYILPAENDRCAQ